MPVNNRALKLGPVYPITHLRSGISHLSLVRSFLEAGVRFFQVRDKSTTDAALLGQLCEIRALCQEADAQFIVNDRVDLALASRANGVHLGQSDLPVPVARSLLGPEAIVGLSTHTEEQFLQAQDMDVDYVALGPVFATRSKKSDHAVIGLDALKKWAQRARRPIVAIGGITPESASNLWSAGVRSVAVISDIVEAPNPQLRIKQYLDQART
jgi:thiamine-phosphate pyrophosphorylase